MVMVLECTTGIYPMGFVPKEFVPLGSLWFILLNVPHKGFVWFILLNVPRGFI